MNNDLSGIFDEIFYNPSASAWRRPQKQLMWSSGKIRTTEGTRGIVIVLIRISRDHCGNYENKSYVLEVEKRLILPLDGVDVHKIEYPVCLGETL